MQPSGRDLAGPPVQKHEVQVALLDRAAGIVVASDAEWIVANELQYLYSARGRLFPQPKNLPIAVHIKRRRIYHGVQKVPFVWVIESYR